MARWSIPARRDLQAQPEYAGREHPDAARRTATQLKKAVESLDAFPQLGREGSVKGTMELVIPGSPYICVYRVRDGRVEILRLLHDRMQCPR